MRLFLCNGPPVHYRKIMDHWKCFSANHGPPFHRKWSLPYNIIFNYCVLIWIILYKLQTVAYYSVVTAEFIQEYIVFGQTQQLFAISYYIWARKLILMTNVIWVASICFRCNACRELTGKTSAFLSKHEIVGNKILSGMHFYIRKTNRSCVSSISDRIFACQNENTYKTMTGTYL
jgi:hypothetical protein